MILQRLYKDANAILEQTGEEGLPPSMYLKKKVRYIIELEEGQPPLFSVLEGEGKGRERGVDMLIPNTKRTVGITPLLFADKPSYVLGIRIPDAKRDAGRDLERDALRTQEEFAAFKALAQECYEATKEPDIEQIVAFLESWNPEEQPDTLPKDLTRDNTLTFRVNGALIVENPAVRHFWAEYGQMTEDGEGQGKRGQCLVSGDWGAMEEMMPVPVKGLRGGKSEMAIVSANASAFESYGLTRAQTSPISRDAGERFGQALNALLASPSHHANIQNSTFIYWSPDEVVPLFVFVPDPVAIRDFVTAFRSGKWQKRPGSKFYLFGLVPNAARVVVRFAIETTIDAIEEAQAEWFERLRIIGFDEKGSLVMDKGFPLKTLVVAAYRDFDGISPGTEDALVRAALLGAPLPDTVLRLLVNRCRAERSVTHPRAALIKYILTQHLNRKEATFMEQEITEARPHTFENENEARAYHLGRLFAELEAIQAQAIPGINAGIADKFYGSASSTPASVFGTLLDGVQNHLAKLRKEKEGAYAGSQKRLEEVLACIDDFPKTLSLKSQAYFSLGYYHYRAQRRKDISEASAAKKATKQALGLFSESTQEGGEDNE